MSVSLKCTSSGSLDIIRVRHYCIAERCKIQWYVMLLYSSSHHLDVSGWLVVICEYVGLLILSLHGSLRRYLHVHQCFSCFNCLEQLSVVACSLRSVSVYLFVVTTYHDFHRALLSSGATNWNCPVYCFKFKTSFSSLFCFLVAIDSSGCRCPVDSWSIQ